MYLFRCVFLRSEFSEEFYPYFMFKGLTVLDWYLANLNIPAQEIGALHMSPNTQNGDFIDNGFEKFY
jgi:hypothetical protein